MREWRASRRELLKRGLTNPEHGADSTYHNYGCRCTDCTKAHSSYEPEQHARKRYKIKLRIIRRAELSNSPVEEPQPDWTPAYLDPKCQTCGTRLLPIDALGSGVIDLKKSMPVIRDTRSVENWAWEHWMCPHCLDFVRFDLSSAEMKDLMKQALDQIPSFTATKEYVAITKEGEVLAEDDNVRAAFTSAKRLPDFLVHMTKDGPIAAPVDVISAFFRLEQTCPKCRSPLLEELQDLYVVDRHCSNCSYRDIWRIGLERT